MVKVTVLYDQPDDPAAFEKYYLETHVQKHGLKIPNVTRFEINKVIANPGEKPAFYRTADLYFDDMASFERSLSSPITQAAIADLDNFAKGRHTMLVSEVTNPVPAAARA